MLPPRHYAVVDGGCNNHTGYAAYGSFKIYTEGKLAHYSGVLPFRDATTSNQAEWMAMIALLECLTEMRRTSELVGTPRPRWTIYNDSELIRKQITGRWQSHDPVLASLRDRGQQLFDWLYYDCKHLHNTLIKQILGH